MTLDGALARLGELLEEAQGRERKFPDPAFRMYFAGVADAYGRALDILRSVAPAQEGEKE